MPLCRENVLSPNLRYRAIGGVAWGAKRGAPSMFLHIALFTIVSIVIVVG